jgi:hypothetical protein
MIPHDLVDWLRGNKADTPKKVDDPPELCCTEQAPDEDSLEYFNKYIAGDR